ncbi:hypothetical protein KP509_35G033500 [Ceratopteris richardii]|uniref:Uncharacterized protein n=1 Tax=Ceratopteris richardii TaxID=49495 RepID=A0A8T2QGE3_CERRI|nr:hypothetical protein KP509_35G033500 [Ceratopteris richardii]
MAGSSTPSMEKFTSQGVEPHQIMMNAEVMKHLRIMNRSSVREIMIQHEKTFKEQVHDLHKLYEVQKLLMDKAESRGREPSTGIQSQVQGKVITEGFNHGRAVDWEQATRNSMGLIRNDAASHNLNNSQKVSRETDIVTGGTSSDNLGRPSPTLLNRTTKLEETIKCVSSPSRKRKIDLEQLPEDSDDEMQNSGDVFKPSASNLSENSREQSAKASSGFECLVTLEPNPQASSKFQPVQTVNLVQVGNPFLGDSSSQNGQSSSSRGDPSYSSQDGQTMPNLSFNTMKAKKNEANPGEVLLSFQDTSILGSDIGSLKNTPTFLPQPDFLDRASQEVGKQTHSFYQASEINAVNAPATISLQQQQTSSHLGVSGNTVNRSYHPIPYSEQTPHNKSTPIDTVNNVFGKALLGMNSPTLASMGARKDAASVLAERLGETSKFFTKDSMLQAPLINAAPMTRLENASPLRGTPVAKPEIGIMAGGKNIEGVVSPAISVAISKGFGHEQDMNFWPSQSSVLKVPQFQQSALFQQTILPPTSQAMWVPSSLNLQNGMYSQQQMAYGFQVTDPSQANHAGDMIQRSQGESPGSWNAVDLGQYYTSIPSIQKPPFKKPPKLVLKNDGFGMELKLVAPETCEEKVNIKKSLNVMKRESPQASSELTNSKGHMNIESVEEDKNLSKKIGSQSLMLNTSTQKQETKMTLGTLIEPKSLAMEVSSCTYKLAPNGLNSDLSLAIDRENLNTSIDCTSDSGISLNFHVSRPPDESTQLFGLLHFDAGLPSLGKENPAKISSLMSSQTAIEKGIPAQMVASDVKNMQGQTEKRSLINEGLDVNVGLHIAEERKESVEKVSASEGVADLVASSQSETFHTEIQALQSERKEVNSNVEELENADINGKMSW